MTQEVKQITVKGRFSTFQDKVTLQSLVQYCDRMGIEFHSLAIQGDIVLTFVGPEDRLAELEDYLRERAS
jgi:hypothetical protein